MKNLLILITVLISNLTYSQIKLKQKYQDFDILKTEIISDIISSYSVLYGDSINVNCVNEEDYNLYYDSLTLWWLTSNKKFYNDKDTNAKSGHVGDFEKVNNVGTKLMLQTYLSTFYMYYLANDIESVYCIPADYKTTLMMYKYESEKKRIKFYNKNRIVSYSYQLMFDKKIDLKGFLYIHKTIKPISDHGARYGFAHGWIPIAYIYPKPKHKVYKSDNLFKDLTGLEDTFNININDLNLDYKFHDKYFDLKEREKDELIVSNNDSIIIFDKDVIDNDKIRIIVNNKKENLTLSDKYVLNINKNIKNITIIALDEGEIGLCTVTLKLGNDIYNYDLFKNEIVSIKLKKVELCNK